jgi:hypothetical protein
LSDGFKLTDRAKRGKGNIVNDYVENLAKQGSEDSRWRVAIEMIQNRGTAVAVSSASFEFGSLEKLLRFFFPFFCHLPQKIGRGDQGRGMFGHRPMKFQRLLPQGANKIIRFQNG